MGDGCRCDVRGIRRAHGASGESRRNRQSGAPSGAGILSAPRQRRTWTEGRGHRPARLRWQSWGATPELGSCRPVAAVAAHAGAADRSCGRQGRGGVCTGRPGGRRGRRGRALAGRGLSRRHGFGACSVGPGRGSRWGDLDRRDHGARPACSSGAVPVRDRRPPDQERCGHGGAWRRATRRRLRPRRGTIR